MLRWVILLGLCLSVLSVVFGQSDETLSIENGQTLVISISATQPTAISYQNKQVGSRIQIEAHSHTEEVDPVIWIVDSRMHLLAYNDNSLDEEEGSIHTDALISGLFLAEEGPYTIYMDSFNGVSEGEVELFIQPDPPALQMNETPERVDIEGFLPENQALQVFTFDAPLGSLFTITAHDLSGTLDPYIQIVNSEGEIVIANDDHQSLDLTLNVFDSQIASWQIVETDVYTLEILDMLGNSGQFMVEILPIN